MGNLGEVFAAFLEAFLRSLGAENVTVQDKELLLEGLTKTIRRLERARKGLSHEWVKIDDRGRITLRRPLLTRLGWEPGDTVDMHLYPNPDRPRGLLLLREEF
jgi:hypothetical protein